MQLELNIFKLPLNIAVIGLCLVVCYSRYYLNYHTLSQVSLGFQLGIIFGFVWLFAIEVVFRNMGGFEYLEEFYLFKYWYFKDSSNIGNVLKIERDYLISLREKTKIKSN
jgi:dolichyldiphosphatase